MRGLLNKKKYPKQGRYTLQKYLASIRKIMKPLGSAFFVGYLLLSNNVYLWAAEALNIEQMLKESERSAQEQIAIMRKDLASAEKELKINIKNMSKEDRDNALAEFESLRKRVMEQINFYQNISSVEREILEEGMYEDERLARLAKLTDEEKTLYYEGKYKFGDPRLDARTEQGWKKLEAQRALMSEEELAQEAKIEKELGTTYLYAPRQFKSPEEALKEAHPEAFNFKPASNINQDSQPKVRVKGVEYDIAPPVEQLAPPVENLTVDLQSIKGTKKNQYLANEREAMQKNKALVRERKKYENPNNTPPTQSDAISQASIQKSLSNELPTINDENYRRNLAIVAKISYRGDYPTYIVYINSEYLQGAGLYYAFQNYVYPLMDEYSDAYIITDAVAAKQLSDRMLGYIKNNNIRDSRGFENIMLQMGCKSEEFQKLFYAKMTSKAEFRFMKYITSPKWWEKYCYSKYVKS